MQRHKRCKMQWGAGGATTVPESFEFIWLNHLYKFEEKKKTASFMWLGTIRNINKPKQTVLPIKCLTFWAHKPLCNFGSSSRCLCLSLGLFLRAAWAGGGWIPGGAYRKSSTCSWSRAEEPAQHCSAPCGSVVPGCRTFACSHACSTSACLPTLIDLYALVCLTLTFIGPADLLHLDFKTMYHLSASV